MNESHRLAKKANRLRRLQSRQESFQAAEENLRQNRLRIDKESKALALRLETETDRDRQLKLRSDLEGLKFQLHSLADRAKANQQRFRPELKQRMKQLRDIELPRGLALA